MQGTVVGLSKHRLRIAVLTDNGYTVFDADEPAFEIGQIVTGALDDHGETQVTIQGTRQTLSVYIEATQAGPESVQSLLSNR